MPEQTADPEWSRTASVGMTGGGVCSAVRSSAAASRGGGGGGASLVGGGGGGASVGGRRWSAPGSASPCAGAGVIVRVTGGGVSCGGGGAADVGGRGVRGRRGHGRRRRRRCALVVAQHEPQRHRDARQNQDQAGNQQTPPGGVPQRPRTGRSPVRRTASADAGHQSRRWRPRRRSRTDRRARRRERRRPPTRPAPGRCSTPSRPAGLPAPSVWPPRRPRRLRGAADGHRRRTLVGGAAHGLQAAADRRGQLGLRGGDDRHPEVFGQRRGDERDAGATARGCDGDKIAAELRCAPGSPAAHRRNRRAAARIASSSSLRVSRTSLRCPGSSATNEVTRGWWTAVPWLPRHCARSRLSEPIAEVPARSMDPPPRDRRARE